MKAVIMAGGRGKRIASLDSSIPKPMFRLCGKPILEYLDLPDGHEVYASLILGYPKYKYNRIPPREEARIDWRV